MKFCGQCGAPLVANCPACGAGNPPEHKFCGQCGAPLDPAGLEVSVASGPDAPRPQTAGVISTLPGEMKQVTVLFCDIVNSTPLTERLGPEGMRDLQRRHADNPDFVGGKTRPGGGAVTPGFDPIIGQAPGGGDRVMDEPYPNYRAGDRRTKLKMPNQFVVLTAAAYFFVPSITALRTVLT
jgi:hypothetical protein